MSDTEAKRRVLLLVTGLTPQVVTETVYALAVQATDPWIPTEVHLITTARGWERARLTLLSDRPGWFRRLISDFGLPPIAFDLDLIHVPDGKDGQPLEDIRTPEDNQLVADFITEQVRCLTQDAAAELHASIAGGRKTMGFYLGYALSLYGRDQDRLSHVLVAPPFESHPAFFYPTPAEQVIFTAGPNGEPLDTRDAEIVLADIPFVRMRHGIPLELRNGTTRFSAAVTAASRALGPPELVIDLDRRRVKAAGMVIAVPPADLAFYAWFARRRLEDEAWLPGVTEKDFEGRSESYRDCFLAEYRRIDPLGDEGRVADRLKHGMDRGYFEQRKSKLHERLRKALGPAATGYEIHGQGRRPRCFSITLAPEAIRFAPLSRVGDDSPWA